jgi:hypothetical protein
MSQIIRDIRFSVRLSDDEKAELNKLSDQLNLDKSATVRYALKLLSQSQIRPNIGIFTTLQQQEIPIQFNDKESHDR